MEVYFGDYLVNQARLHKPVANSVATELVDFGSALH
jgi:hypothetical protein